MERLLDTVRFRSKGVHRRNQDIGHHLAESLAIGGGEAPAWDPVTKDMTTIKKEQGGGLTIHSQRDGRNYPIDGCYAAQDHEWSRTRQIGSTHRRVRGVDSEMEPRNPHYRDDD